MNPQFKMTEVKPRIFFLNFKKQYDCNMMFLRYQEYYESSNPKFRGKPFKILEFIEWYTGSFGKGVFSYMRDWAGFNIPGHIIYDVWDNGIPDENDYDNIMDYVREKCEEKYPDGQFYIIGAVGKNGALRHEIAHGFFYTQPEYKKQMTKLVKALKPAFRVKMYRTLKKIGYTPKVYIDECQAYLSTGLMGVFPFELKDEAKPFIKLYREYYNG